ncbi:MAG TPA: glycosyltransferase [Vicinamibacterales bacterium]|nr:glycosyltransferase [Vicinamibacterales bacterium]
MKPLVSVVITNYNCGRFVADAVETALGQSYPHVEVIVVDDGSTDDSLSVLAPYRDRVRVVAQPNQGVSGARNTGIRESRGDLVAFFDADDRWHRDKLAKQVPLFANPAVGLVYCGVEYIDERGNSLGTNLRGLRGRVLRDIALLRETVVLAGGSTAVVRKRLFDAVGGFDPELSTAADWDMWRRIACVAEIDVAREPLMQYRLRAGSMHRNPAVFEHDMLYGFARMFADPAAREVKALRRRGYAKLYLMLSGSFFEAGDAAKAMTYAVRSIVSWPPSAAYICALPLRRVRRMLGAQPDEPRLGGSILERS